MGRDSCGAHWNQKHCIKTNCRKIISNTKTLLIRQKQTPGNNLLIGLSYLNGFLEFSVAYINSLLLNFFLFASKYNCSAGFCGYFDTQFSFSKKEFHQNLVNSLSTKVLLIMMRNKIIECFNCMN